MSADTRLDQRLREAFGADDDWIPDIVLADVRAEARRTTGRRRVALAAAAAVVLTGGVTVTMSRGGGSDGADPVAPVPTSSPSVRSAVEGSWVSEPLTEARVRSALDRAGLGESSDAVIAELRPGRKARLLLRIEGGYLDLQIKRQGDDEPEYVDHETYVVDGDRIVLTPRAGTGETTYIWAITGSLLDLTILGTTEPDVEGVPAVAHQVAIYTAVSFQPST
jgi:hypothetical protein